MIQHWLLVGCSRNDAYLSTSTITDDDEFPSNFGHLLLMIGVGERVVNVVGDEGAPLVAH
jgi:hypothetical protein